MAYPLMSSKDDIKNDISYMHHQLIKYFNTKNISFNIHFKNARNWPHKKAERFFTKLKQELSVMNCNMIAKDFLQQ